MIEFLSKRFIKNYKDIHEPTVRRAYGIMVSIIGITVNFLLAIGKLVVGILSASVAVCADAVNNLSDAGSSLISFVCFRISAKPADRGHPYGHARIEYVASLLVSFLILLIGVELLRDSALTLHSSVVHSEETEKTVFSWITVAVLAVSILGKLFLVFVNRGIGKRIDSAVMRAAMTDSLADIASTSAVLVATVVAGYVTLPFSLDSAMGIFVSLFILYAGAGILREAQNSILGTAPSEETVKVIRHTVSKYPEMLGLHDLAVHEYGSGVVLSSFHVEVDGARDIFAVHDTVDNIERELWEKHRIRATVHLDPVAVGDPDTDRWRAIALVAVRSVDESITIHDFRAVKGHTHSNLVFDIAVPFECKRKDDELIQAIENEIRAVDERLYTVITVDRV